MNRKMRLLVANLLVLMLLAGIMSSASAEPTYVEQINEKQNEMQKVQEELEILDRDLEIIIEEYNFARVELQKTQEKLRNTRINLSSAVSKLEGQKNVLNQRISNIYKNGEISFLEILLDIKDFNDFLVRLDFLRRIGEQDADLVYKFQRNKEAIETIEAELEKLQSEQVLSKEKIESKKKEIERTLNVRNNRLASLSEETKELIRKENERKAQEQARLIERIRGGLGNINVHVEPGTVAATALLYLGVPYVWGGETPNGFDCSGLVYYVFKKHGINLYRTSKEQFVDRLNLGSPVSKENLRPGDLVFFGSPIHHVGIYIGDGYFVHAPRTGDVVRITPLSDRGDYAGARRYI